MSERKACTNCDRSIDIAAKSCPYCNWWQADTPPSRPEPAAVEASAAAPQQQWNWKRNRNILGAIAFVALLIIAFVIGSLIHGFEPSEVKAAQQPKPAAVSTVAVTPTPTANIPLVPDNSAPAGAPPEEPATTAPSTNSMNGSMTEPRDDVTAMPSEQYGAATQRPAAPQTQSVDPRSITRPAYRPSAPRPQRRVAMTQPVPEYQPVPSLFGHGRARLALTVGTDGRVHDIDVVQPLAGDMGRLIGAVQSWRFKPATDNGVPVTSRFTVDINVE
jgi:hypothetical protein